MGEVRERGEGGDGERMREREWEVGSVGEVRERGGGDGERRENEGERVGSRECG